MIGYSILFFILATIFAILGFGGVSGAGRPIAQILFFAFSAVTIVSVILGRGKSSRS